MKVEISFANLEDLEFICKIDKESFSKSYEKKYFENCIENKKILVAKYEKKVVGFILFTVVLDESEILKIATDKNFRNLSIGSFLMENYIDFVNLDLKRKLMLEVRVSNFYAIRLYEKFGYKIIRTIKNYYLNPLEDGLFMLRGN